MKILFICHKMNLGGTEKSLLSLLDLLKDKGFIITVLLLEKGGVLELELPDYVNIRYVTKFEEFKSLIYTPPIPLIRKLINQKEHAKAFRHFSTYVRVKLTGDWFHFYKNVLPEVPFFGEYDISIAFAGPSDFISYLTLKRTIARKKVQWNHFDVNNVINNPSFGKKFYPHFDQFFSVSENAKKSFDKMFPFTKERSKVFPNIVSKVHIQKEAATGEGFVDDFSGLRIVTLGRLSQEKGQQQIPNVVKRLKAEGFDFKWYLIGEGKLIKSLKDEIKSLRIEEDLILLGSIMNPYPFLKQCDLYVQTSLHEGYCITLEEAKVFDKPVVTTNFLSAPNLINHNEDGLIVDISEEGLHQGVKTLLENEDLRNKFSKSTIVEIDYKKHIETLLALN